MSEEEMAYQKFEIRMQPSPKKVILKSSVLPSRLTITIPIKPKTHPASFTTVNRSLRNRKQATRMTINGDALWTMEDFTPEELATPV